MEYETLPIELGEIRGLRTRIEMIAVPGGSGQAPTRKQLLDEIDGVVMVVDSRRECSDGNADSLNELREMLRDYGRSLEDVPLVLQYNKRDLSDPYAIEELHRRLNVPGAAVFESVATDGTGVLQTLSTLSKHVIRELGGQTLEVQGAESDAAPTSGDTAQVDSTTETTGAEPTPSSRMEEALLTGEEHPESDAIEELAREAEEAFDASWDDVIVEAEPSEGATLGAEFSIASVGEATRSGERGVRIPLVVADKRGERTTLVLTIQLDPLLEGDPD